MAEGGENNLIRPVAHGSVGALATEERGLEPLVQTQLQKREPSEDHKEGSWITRSRLTLLPLWKVKWEIRPDTAVIANPDFQPRWSVDGACFPWRFYFLKINFFCLFFLSFFLSKEWE
ncbi:uncharacterized protein LOC143434565 isoform X2 [Arvicanthis niloticus]|uniref:uncharacterized protein LOC143434565 isoform X2 n=1 Tax=Arvicanthis niloticus TaxID=61156 RepID=UPI00403D2576